ncbi:hypothetical protein N9219_05165 [bacterium]|nr:hypothetical protein [bacterium]
MINKSVSVFVVAIIFAFSTNALAGWEPYDDFSSPGIDWQRWSIDNSSATISVENEQAKFVHQSGHPGDSAYLNLIQNPETILGIKTDVFIESCTGDVRSRIRVLAGKMGENHVGSGLKLRTDQQVIYTGTSLEGPPPDYTFVETQHYAEFQTPIIDMIGVTFNLTMVFESYKITYEVDGLGKIVYKYATPVAPAEIQKKAIGTWSPNGDGPCTVYFDNVYVLRP